MTNVTGTAASLTAGTVTTNANLTGDVTSSGNATTFGTSKTLVTPTIAQINNSSAPGVKLQLRTQTDDSNSIASATTAGLIVQYGWGQIVGNATTNLTDTVTFPTAFTTIMGFTVCHVGGKTGSAATSITDLNVSASTTAYAAAGVLTTTTAGVTLSRGTSYGATSYYGYTWIAWGV